MRLSTSAALVFLVLGATACQSATVRGTGGRSLTATTPVSMTMRRGTSAPLEIGIDRAHFTGPVTVSLFALPKGVDSDTSSVRAETTSATFILKASDVADRVTNQAVGVTVEDPDGRRATQFVSLSVTD